MSQQPIIQQPTTPQYNTPQQLYPQLPNVSDVPTTIPTVAQSDSMYSRQKWVTRPQVARNLQYKDNTIDKQQEPIPPQTGFTIDSFRLLSVLGRGHFGKVILSQYKKTGMHFFLFGMI